MMAKEVLRHGDQRFLHSNDDPHLPCACMAPNAGNVDLGQTYTYSLVVHLAFPSNWKL